MAVKKKRRRFKQNTIAMVYDFDGTLTPKPMQEYTVLPELGIEPKQFWREVDEECKKTGSEHMLVYMRLMLEKADENKVHIGKKELGRLARHIEYFPGVKSWFQRIDSFVNEHGGNKVKIQHYIISAGIKEILERTALREHFRQVYASEFHYNHHGVAVFPKLVITDTTKTQFLFRINKGKEQLTESINEHMPDHKRPIPFANIIYIGDGQSDVPSMAVTKQNGGNTIAVYRKGSKHGLEVCRSLLEAGRVHFMAPADYSAGSILEKRVRLLLSSVIANIEYERELFVCKREQALLPS